MRCPSLSVHRAALRFGDQTAVVAGEVALSFRELSSEVRVAQAELRGRFAPGDRLALTAEPNLPSLVLLSAVLEEGGVPCLLHSRFPSDTRTRLAAEVGALVGWEPSLERGPAKKHRSPNPSGSTASPQAIEGEVPAEPEADGANERDFALFFTSGSTGLPKGVRLSGRAFCAAARASALNLGWKAEDRWLCSLPLAHIGGFSVLTRTRLGGRTLVLPDPNAPSGFDPRRFGELLRRQEVSLASVVPTMLARLVREELSAPPTLRAMLVGGAPLDPELARSARALGWPTIATYGLTEACSQVASQRPGAEVAEGVGIPLAGVEVEATSGRLRIRGPTLFSGYVPGGARPVDAEGWFETGDLGRFDAQGQLRIDGRARDLVITGGENVAPGRVESALRSLEGIDEAVVLGIPDREWGEVVAAVLVLSVPRPRRFRPAGLRRQLEGRLADFERPRRVFVADGLPLLPSGKIDRAEVRRGIRGAGFGEVLDDLS